MSELDYPATFVMQLSDAAKICANLQLVLNQTGNNPETARLLAMMERQAEAAMVAKVAAHG